MSAESKDAQLVQRFQNLDCLNALPDKLGYAFSHSDFGNMSFNYGQQGDVLKSRERFARAAGFPLTDTVVMYPVQGINTQIVSSKDRGLGVFEKESAIPSTDALITTEKNLPLVVNPADCAPIIMTDADARFLAMVHAGRSGTDLFIPKIVTGYLEKLGFTDPGEFLIGIGPSASHCYSLRYLQTGNLEDWQPFLTDLADNGEPEIEQISLDPPIYKAHSKYEGSEIGVKFVDYIKKQLLDIGVKKENISTSPDCTIELAGQHQMYSHEITYKYSKTYLKDEFPECRFMAVAWLKDS